MPHTNTMKDHVIYPMKSNNGSSHQLIADYLNSYPSNIRILDIGTANGTLGRLCPKHKRSLYGIEPQKESAREALPYYRTIISSSLENAPPDFIRGYHIIVLADVLEHMVNPEIALQQLLIQQSPGTILIISVPNIANIWIRLNLLFGHFDYTNLGILDKTHLHFYTLKSIREFLSKYPLMIQKVETTPIPINLAIPQLNRTLFGKIVSNLLRLLTPLAPTLLVYQFIIYAKKV